MTTNLLDLATNKLLGKFGQGSHKPGSGSAAALNTMLAVELLRTVISLTVEDKRSFDYGKVKGRFLSIQKDLGTRIYPELEDLFHKDAIEFDRVITLRKLRDETIHFSTKEELGREARLALKPAVEIPLKIALVSVEVAKYSLEVFDNGFQAARGDTSVSINNSIATIAECLSIVELNLKTCVVDDWYDEIKKTKKLLKSEYHSLQVEGTSRLDLLEKEAEDIYKYQKVVQELKSGNRGKKLDGDQELQNFVSRLQNTLYVFHDLIWKKGTLIDTVDLLDPKAVLRKVLGFQVQESEDLGFEQHGTEFFEVAGLIDKNRNLVLYSSRIPEKVANFTIAHELGHALLHDKLRMHRDRAMDTPSFEPRSFEEAQADKFAAYFLMPQKLVIKAFSELFQTNRFQINSKTALGLRVGVSDLTDHCETLRDLSRLLASTKYYAGKSFNSLSHKFKVSEEAMAIRLEELQLISFIRRTNATSF
jgi:Zn-dependent peptidase ImmA (M78 family)/formiminotetrahydrofolate cyclodeaminase